MTAQEPQAPGAKVPTAAAWLGGAGALPFIAGVALYIAGEPLLAAWGVAALRAYGAVILSFMAGIHWGLAMADSGTGAGQGASWGRLGLSVTPALIGWLALLVPRGPGLVLLAVTFTALLAIDLVAVRRGMAPAWYPRLRWPLTCIVVACLLLAAI